MTTDRDNNRPAFDQTQRRPFFSLKYKMLVYFGLLFTVSLVVMEVVSLFGAPYTDYEGEFYYQQNKIFRNLNQVADSEKKYLVSLIEERKNNIMALAKSEMLRDDGSKLHALLGKFTASGMQGGALWNAMRKEKSFKTIVGHITLLKKQYKMYEEIEIADIVTGIVIASTDDDDLGENVFKKYAFMASRENGNLSKISFDKMGDNFHLHFTEPVLDIETDASGENQIILVLIAHVNSSAVIYPLLHTGRGLNKTGEVVLVDSDTRIIAPLKYKLPNGLTAVPLEYQIKAKPAMMGASGEEGITISDDYRGEPVLAAYRHILISPDIEWGMVVKIDKSEAFAPLYQRLEAVTFAGVIGLVVTLLLAWFLAYRMSTPLMALSRAAEKVEKGEMDTRVESTGFIETYMLASAFNSMATKIHTRRMELEDLVLKRTMELQSINADLVSEIVERKTAEQVLRESEGKYRGLFENANDSIFISDPDSHLLLNVNENAAKRLGYTRQELLRMKIDDLYSPDDKTIIAPNLKKLLEGQSIVFETFHKRKDGSRMPIEISSRIIEYGGRRVIQSFSRDITERKNAEEALEKKTGLVNLLQEITSAANNSSTVDEAIQVCLDKVCDYTGWELGHAYMLDFEDTLIPTQLWRIDDPYRFKAFYEITKSITPTQGVGLPGCVLQSGQAVCFPDLTQDQKFLRAKEAVESGLKTGFGFPVLEKKKTVAVLTFFTTKSAEPDEPLFKAIENIGAQLGRVTERKRAKKEIEHQKTMFESIFDGVADAIIFTDTKRRVVMLNPGFTRILGYSLHDVAGKETGVFYESWEIYKRLGEERFNLSAKEKLKPYVVNYRRKDGVLFPGETTGTIIKDKSGEIVGFIGVVRDITERKQAEEALQESERRLAEAQKLAGIGSWERDLITDKMVWSEQLYIMQGFDPGKKPPSYKEVLNLVHPDDRELVREAWDKAKNEGIPYEMDLRFKRIDGSVFTIHAVTKVEKDVSGRPVKIKGVFHDITERKRAEEELDRFFALSLDLLCIAGTDGYFKRVNPAFKRILDYTTEEMLSKPLLDFIHPDDRETTIAEIEKQLKSEPTLSFENRYLCKDGSVRHLEWNAYAVPDEGSLYAIARDITERKKAEEELKRHRDHLEEMVEERTNELSTVNKELEAFAYSVSHDLRAPLRGIDGFSKALLEDYADKVDDTGKDYLNRVSAATLKMSQLIDDLLTLSRVTRSEVTAEPVDLGALAHDVADDLRKEQPDRRVKISIEKDLVAQGDKRLLRVVLYNLMSNSWKFTWKRLDASIEIGATRHDEKIVYFVRDNGVGFDMKYADKLFGAFQRLHTLSEFPGTGIGLAIVQRIVHRHGGRVWAEAEVDKGAIFYLTL